MIRSAGPSVVVVVDERTKVGEARRRSVELAARLGFDEARQATIALIVTEAATNLVKHSGGGQLILDSLIRGPGDARLDILTVDLGRGMSDLSRCLADGYSSAGSPGTGLGAIHRLADALEIYSEPETGTILRACVELKPRVRDPRLERCDLGVARVCAPGELVCGDDWALVEREGQFLVLVVDGLGHGHAASLAAEEATNAFGAHQSIEPGELLGEIHRAIRGTRGAAVAIARIDPALGTIRYAGVGNISGVVAQAATGEIHSMVSMSGTVGHSIRKIQAFDYSWTESSLILMHSDGMATHWNLERSPGILRRHPRIIAGALYRDFSRGRDDTCVLVARFAQGAST